MKHILARSLVIVGLAISCAVTATTSSAAAPDPRGEPSVHVDIHRMDLTRPDAVAQLYARLQSSARKACRDASSSSDTGALRNFDRCYAAALSNAVESAQAPLLTALHQQRIGSAPLRQAKN